MSLEGNMKAVDEYMARMRKAQIDSQKKTKQCIRRMGKLN